MDQPTTAPPGHPQYVRRGWDVAEQPAEAGGMWQSNRRKRVGCGRGTLEVAAVGQHRELLAGFLYYGPVEVGKNQSRLAFE
ncbi:hypothetical protein Pure04_16530 [Paenarthrobacter ureafaciens]|nr:hypothetical protein Pure04_16530 [Paenarthrobacter ureafaciens]